MARSFHPVIVAILFVKAVGFGALADALCLRVFGQAPGDATAEQLERAADMVDTDPEGARERVEAAAGGRIGYIHLRAMGEEDMAAWTAASGTAGRRAARSCRMAARNGAFSSKAVMAGTMAKRRRAYNARAAEPSLKQGWRRRESRGGGSIPSDLGYQVGAVCPGPGARTGTAPFEMN